MKAITPNVALPWIDGLYLISLPSVYDPYVCVRAQDYRNHELHRYRWYLGARGLVVASVGPERSTVYLARLISGAQPGERVTFKQAEPYPIPGKESFKYLDYTPENLTRTIYLTRTRHGLSSKCGASRQP